MLKFVAKHAARSSGKITRSVTDVARATPGYFGSVVSEAQRSWTEGYNGAKPQATKVASPKLKAQTE